MTTRAIQKIVLLGLAASLALIAWGLLRFSSLEEQVLLPKVSFDKSADRIDISSEGKTTTFVKKDESWEVKEGDVLFPGDAAMIESVIKTFSNLELQDIVSKNKDRHAVLGFEEVGVVEVVWFDGEEKKGTAFIGGQDYSRGGDYVRIGGEATVYLTKGRIRPIFSRGNFKDLQVIASDAALISKVALEYPDAASSMTLVKKKQGEGAEEWIFENDGAAPINQDAVRTFVQVLSSLRADDIKERGAAVEYGFGKPALTVLASVDGKEAVVTIGGKTSDDASYYARVSGKDEWVYLLSSSSVNDQLMKRREDFEKKEEENKS